MTMFYFATWVPLISKNFSFHPLKKFVIPLLLLIVVGFVFSALNSQYVDEMRFAFHQRALLLIVLMTFIASHIYNKPKILPFVLNSYIASILLLFLLVTLGQGVTYIHGRIYLFGENPNVLGVKAVLAFLIAMSKLISNFSFKRMAIIVPICLPFISLTVLSGSRGAFISMFLGLGVLLFFRKTGVVNKWAIFIIGVFASSFLISYLLETNPVIASRLLETVEKGDTGRNVLWDAAFNIIADHTIIGTGFAGVIPMMYAYSGIPKNPHNIFLYLFISCGLPGILLFITFLVRLAKSLLRHYRVYGNSLNLVLFVIVIFNMSKQGGSIGKILFWLFFAILIGSTAHVLPNYNKQKRLTE
ncbi:O-antigen ligase family protein [Flagellimonas meridianipacifica]|nr:O-antigen ligase family protein [Allomuricauda pacifica]